MSSLKKIILAAILLLSSHSSLAAQVKLETKVFGKDVIFIFYHDNTIVLDLSTKEQTVFAITNIPVEYTNVNPDIFKQYTSNVRQSNNNQTYSFATSKELQYVSVIKGEKLEAIKFKAQQKVEEDLSTIGRANNDPDAVKYSRKDNVHTLTFDLESDKTKAAAFVRGKYLWVIFDKEKIFTFKQEGIFTNFAVVPSSSGTVLRIRMDENYDFAKLNRTNNGWSVSLTPDSTDDWKKNLELVPEALLEEDGYIIKGDFSKHQIISFEDPEFGDILKVVPVNSSGARVLAPKQNVEYSILKTLQGIAISMQSDEIEIERFDEAIKIVSDAELDDYIVVDANIFPGPIDEFLELPTVLPYLDKNLNILDFNERKAQLILEAATAEDDEEGFEKNLELARFFFIHEWYHEAADVLEYAKKRYPDEYTMSFPGRFLNAVSHTLKGEFLKAKDEYSALLAYNNVKSIPEVNIWYKYNNHGLGSNPGSIGIVDNLTKSLSLYSDDKYWPLAFAEIELGLFANDLKTVEKLFKELRNPPGGNISNSLKYYKANYYRKKGQLNLAKQYLSDLVYRQDDVMNSTRAEFDLIKLQIEMEEIDMERAIEALEKLRFKWRGDQLEYEILLQLANYYRDNRDILSALRTYKYIQSAFSNKVSNFYVTSEMAKIFNDVFLPNGLRNQMDDFTLVALFYEFKELNPIGEKGDNVILEIARRLVRLDLLENAADLLRHQIKFRLTGEKRVANADNLAVVLMMDKKPHEAMIVLDETDRDNFNFSEHQYRLRLRGRAMIDLENYSEAFDILKDDSSDDAEIIRREALFRSKKWSEYADRMNSKFDTTIGNVGESPAAAQDILRLAISYYMLGVNDQLVMISQAIGSSNPELKDTIDLMVSNTDPIDVKNLDQSLNINQMENLLAKYKNQFLDGDKL